MKVSGKGYDSSNFSESKEEFGLSPQMFEHGISLTENKEKALEIFLHFDRIRKDKKFI